MRNLNRRKFLKSTAAATGALLVHPAYRGRAVEADPEAVLERAQEGIRRHRMSELRIHVIGQDQQPLSGIGVSVGQLRHRFLWGANLFGWARSGGPDLEADYRSRFASLFNFATLGFYWHYYEPEQGHPQYAWTEGTIDWCQANSITCKGHPLVWANIEDPGWLPEDAEGIRAASLGRVREIVDRFRGRIDLWDVVNEPSLLLWATTRLGQWAQAVGTRSFVSQHLHAAREANPNAILLVNEVLTAYPVYSLLDDLREQGKPLFDAVGLQSHMHRGPWPLDRMWSLCDRYAGLGVPLHFSEFTLLSGPGGIEGHWETPTPESEQAQAEDTALRYTLLFGHPSVQAVSWWDLSDRGAWKAAPAGLLRADMSPKPAYDQLYELIRKRWWTSIQGRTNASGKFSCRAFHGQHRITVRSPDGHELHRDLEVGPNRDTETAFVF